jgi:hypothetical protein
VKKKLIGDVWDDIPDCMHSPVGERTAFTTQKPETLLMRIIEAATDKGALVCDFFSGSGTTGVVSEKLGRRWIICEKEVIGIQVSRNRLIEKTRRPFVIERIKRGQREKALSPYSKRLRLLRPAVKEISEDKVEISIGLEGYSPGKGGKGGKGHEGFPSKKTTGQLTGTTTTRSSRASGKHSGGTEKGRELLRQRPRGYSKGGEEISQSV